MEVQGSSRLASRWVADVVVDPSWTTPVLFENRTMQLAILATSENLEKLLEEFVATEAGSSPDVDGSSTARAALSEPLLHRWMKLDGRGCLWLRKRLVSPRANKYQKVNCVETRRRVKAPSAAGGAGDVPTAFEASQGSNPDSSQGSPRKEGPE